MAFGLGAAQRTEGFVNSLQLEEAVHPGDGKYVGWE